MQKPNIIFIHLDQWHARALSALGNTDVSTPNIDALFTESVSFENSYSSNPICCPARTSWYTGMPSCEHGVITNSIPAVKGAQTIAYSMKARGYKCYYAGKWHIPGIDIDKEFDVIDTGFHAGETGDLSVAKSAVGFLSNYAESEPFFLNLGFLNPHDCCYITMGEKPGKDLPTKFGFENHVDVKLPELPKSFIPSAFELGADAMRLRTYYYYRLLELVDKNIGDIRAALKNSKYANNTYCILTADHGDMLGEFGETGKSRPQNAAFRVPLLICGPEIPQGRRDTDTLCTSADIAATILDFAGAERLGQMRECSKSLKPALLGYKTAEHEYAVGEIFRNDHSYRMLVSKERKYILDLNRFSVEVYDLKKDPWELDDISKNPAEVEGIAKAVAFSNEFTKRAKVCERLAKNKKLYDALINFKV